MTMITESRADIRSLTRTGLFASIFRAFSNTRRDSRSIVELSAMDDHILRDIGLTRADVMQASVDGAREGLDMLHRTRAGGQG